jgi:hypothetical protein
MKFINAQQLAFVLDIKKHEARGKMCVAWAKHTGIQNTAYHNNKGKLIDDYPLAMEIEMLSRQLNLPTLQSSVEDIVNNFLIRPASKRWILCDYPEKQIKKLEESGKPLKLNVPSALKSLLSESDIQKIKSEWSARYKNAIV